MHSILIAILACQSHTQVTVQRVWGVATGPHSQQLSLLVLDSCGQLLVVSPRPLSSGWALLQGPSLDRLLGCRVAVWGSGRLEARHTRATSAKLFQVPGDHYQTPAP